MAGILDTQNQHWVEDKSKFGYRMLQKMGWSEGKGLGMKENGVTEHVRVRKKSTTAGVGATPAARDVWKVPGQVASGLNDVLARLAAAADEGAVAVVQADGVGKRKLKKARGYYQRRAAHKTVGNYSESELKEIFGGVAPVAPPAVSTDKDERQSADEGEKTTSGDEQKELDRRERKKLRQEKRERKEKKRKAAGEVGEKSKIKKREKKIRKERKDKKR